jgi:hypothetical protein
MAYRIELNSDLKPGNYVYNRANGDFDSRWKASSNMVSVMAKDPSAGMQNTKHFEGQIWPNPASGELYVRLNILRDSKYSVLDVSGKMLLHGIIQGGDGSIAVGALSKGVYLLQTDAGVCRFVIN